MYLAEALKVEVQELFPKRVQVHRIHEFLDRLEKTRV